jgi:cyanophycinase
MHPGPGPLALVGSGEYLAVMAGVEGALIEGRPPRFVQIPTAAAPEGPQRLRYWLDLGAAQAERLGVEPVPVLVLDRDEAGSEDLAALIHGAGLIYLSGGNPQFLARTLRGTRVWAAVEAAWRSGAALAGCSAGAIALTDWVPAVRSAARAPEPGLGVLPWLRVLPHFDRIRSWAPGPGHPGRRGRAPRYHGDRHRRGHRDRRPDRRRRQLAGARPAAGLGAERPGWRRSAVPGRHNYKS